MKQININVSDKIFKVIQEFSREHNQSIVTTTHNVIDDFAAKLAGQKSADVLNDFFSDPENRKHLKKG